MLFIPFFLSALVMSGLDGLDELVTLGRSEFVWPCNENILCSYTFKPTD